MAKKMITFDHAVIYGGKFYPANTPIEAIKEPKKQDDGKQDDGKQDDEPNNEPDNQDDKEGEANDK